MSISFSTYDVSYQLPEANRIRAWIKQVVENKGFRLGSVHVIFCSDTYILKTNQQFLRHDYPTDIITFDYSTRKKISGDILISIPTVKNNSERFNVNFFDETLRVIIHGILHLLGYHDYTDEEREIMREAEDEALSFY